MDAAAWLADYRGRLERIAEGARQASETVAQIGATATSPRGEVTVSVNAGGALQGVKLTPMARKLEAEALADLIVRTAQEAQRQAGARMAEVMSDYLGDSPALAQITQHLPAEVGR
ncbi:YbaB/EbfC family nucleoid-associated protein [Saccharomonospora sp. NB11]|jgi:DNA-binding protein YbaB|uniref:YbaB/EbfC family nucleoid-associated protein n=1 Tax=Saccharomonospora sp. NB11 TaxID=1642298 RepID=UPI0018D08F4A|nr:YbaB/EbfC family nucleoid-associated protein [Saccharomonospora sp. NB11]